MGNEKFKEDINAYHNPDLSRPIEQRVRDLAASLTKDETYAGWDTEVLKAAKFIKASEGKTEFELTVTPSMCNKGGNLHGGCAATILDNCSTTSLLTLAKPGFMDVGSVSRTMTLTYLRPVKAGQTVKIFCEAVQAGRTFANCKGEIRTLDGKPCVALIHDKAVVSRARL